MITTGVDVMLDILSNLEDVNINLSELVDGLIKGIVVNPMSTLKSEPLLADISYARKLLNSEERMLKMLEKEVLRERIMERERIKRMEGRECNGD